MDRALPRQRARLRDDRRRPRLDRRDDRARPANVSGDPPDRAGEPRHGGRKQHRDASRVRALLPAPELGRVGSRRGHRRARAVRRRPPRRSGRRPAAAQPGRVAPALGAGVPDSLAPHDRVPLPTQAGASLARAEHVLRRRVRPRRGTRGRLALPRGAPARLSRGGALALVGQRRLPAPLALRRVPIVLLAAPALALARLLPASGVGLGLRLAAATACLLIPGALISRALRLRGFAPAVAWSLAALLFAMAVMFALHRSLWLTLALLAGIAVGALPFAVLASDLDHRVDWAKLAVVGAGIGFGIALWSVAVLDGDAFFHLARVRKLEVFGSLSLQDVGEFKDASLHPGYAFPLWHGFLALVARLADVDPIAVGRNEPTVLAPLSFALFYEAGRILFRSAWAGMAVVVAQATLTGIAAGHGGSFTSLALPATASRQVLVPGLLALFFAHVREPSAALLASTAAAAGTLALVHPTYALFVGVPLIGFAIARALLVRRELAPSVAGIASLAVPTGIALAWLRPVVEATTIHNPSGQEVRRAFAQYPGQLAGG